MTRICVLGAAAIFNLAMAADSVPIIKFDTGDAEIQVEETGRLQIVDSPDADNLADTPAGTSAGRLALAGKSVLWSPAPKPGSLTPAADLADAALAPDESALAVISYVGRAPAVSSRVVIINLLNGKLINAFTLDREKVLSAVFMADGRRLAAVTAGQPETGRVAGLLVIEPGDPPRIHKILTLPEESAPVLKSSSDGRLWVQTADRRTAIGVDPDQAEITPLRVRLASPSAVAVSPDGAAIAAVGKTNVEWHDTTRAPDRLTDSFPCDSPDFTQTAILDAKRRTLLASSDGGELAVIRGGAAVRLADEAAGIFCLDRNGERLFAAVKKHDGIAVYSMPGGVKPEATVSPGKLKPLTRGGIFRLFALTSKSGELLVIDDCSRLFKLTVKPRRWEKKMIFAPELAPRK